MRLIVEKILASSTSSPSDMLFEYGHQNGLNNGWRLDDAGKRDCGMNTIFMVRVKVQDAFEFFGMPPVSLT